MFLVRVGRGTVALRPPTFLSLRSAPNLRKHGLPSKRSFSSSTMQSTESTSPSPVGAIGSLTSELDKLAPRFELQPSQLTILTSPDVFYSTLKQRILKAKERVFLSTLYIGKAEHELVRTWNHKAEEEHMAHNPPRSKPSAMLSEPIQTSKSQYSQMRYAGPEKNQGRQPHHYLFRS